MHLLLRVLVPTVILVSAIAFAGSIVNAQVVSTGGGACSGWQANYNITSSTICGVMTDGWGYTGSGCVTITTVQYLGEYATVDSNTNDICTVGISREVAATINVNPQQIVRGSTAQLTWGSVNAESCSINQGIGSVPLQPDSSTPARMVSPTNTTTYTITCTDSFNRSVSANTTLTVTDPALVPPTVTFAAVPSAIPTGGTSNLRWYSENATSCEIDKGIGSVPPNTLGATPVSPATNTTYKLTCTGPGGERSAYAAVSISDTASCAVRDTWHTGPSTQYHAAWTDSDGYIESICPMNADGVYQYWNESITYPGELNEAGDPVVFIECWGLNTRTGTQLKPPVPYSMVPQAPAVRYRSSGTCSGPDLTAGESQVTGAVYGQVGTITAPISNSGPLAAGVSAAQIEIQAPSAKNSKSAYPSVPALAAQGLHSVSTTFKFVEEGAYRIRACADHYGAVVEMQEDNNCGPWTEVYVMNTVNPNSVQCSVDSTTVQPGQSVTYTATANGAASAPYTWTSPDSAANYGTGQTAMRTFPANASGQFAMQVVATNGANTAQCPLVTVGASCPTGTADLTITASPTRVRQGETSTVTWTASGVGGADTTCTLSGPGVSESSGPIAPPSCSFAGNASPVINTQSVYTLTCGSQSESVIVNVIPRIIEF